MLIDAGLPRPQKQIPVRDDVGHLIGYLDMGWQDIMVAVEYDGEQHRTDRRQYTWDVRRLERLESIGWVVECRPGTTGSALRDAGATVGGAMRG